MRPGPKATPLIDRLRARAAVTPDGCWIFASLRPDGYGQIWVGSRVDGTRRLRKARVVSYELHVGPVPDGLVLDHLCRNRACIRPDHLEPVAQTENVRRSPAAVAPVNSSKTHCPRQHPYDEANTYVDRHGKRYCRACRAMRDQNGRWKA